jgi:hypothetical protein
VQVSLAVGQGPYTVRITPAGTATSGIALAEIYDADPNSVPAQLIHVSTPGFGGTGERALSPGFAIRGTRSKRLLLRAVGPGLVQFGVADVMADPLLNVIPQGQTANVGGNNDWGGTATLRAAFTTAGAFALEDGSKDAAVVLTLPPGVYSAAVVAVGNATGTVLLEVYDID